MTPCSIRTATVSDALVLARLRYAFRCELGSALETEEAFVARCAAWMGQRLGGAVGDTCGGHWRCWVAEDGDVIVGTVWVQRFEKMPNPVDEAEHHAYITNLYVHPDRRGGIGSRLLETALDWCRVAGVDAVLLWPSERSRSLYERQGFAVRGDLMELRLASR
jgi:GNAT superfamily N-acetyltransferase